MKKSFEFNLTSLEEKPPNRNVPITFNLNSTETKPRRICRKPALPKGREIEKRGYKPRGPYRTIYSSLFEEFLASNKRLVKLIILKKVKTYSVYFHLKRITSENIRISIRDGEIYLERLDLDAPPETT